MCRQIACRAPWAAPIQASAAIAAAPAVQCAIFFTPVRLTLPEASLDATPARSAGWDFFSVRVASAAVAPVARASTRPRSSMTTARAGCSERSTPRLSIDVPLPLLALERQPARVRRPEQLAIHARQQLAQPALVG